MSFSHSSCTPFPYFHCLSLYIRWFRFSSKSQSELGVADLSCQVYLCRDNTLEISPVLQWQRVASHIYFLEFHNTSAGKPKHTLPFWTKFQKQDAFLDKNLCFLCQAIEDRPSLVWFNLCSHLPQQVKRAWHGRLEGEAGGSKVTAVWKGQLGKKVTGWCWSWETNRWRRHWCRAVKGTGIGERVCAC